MNRAIGDNLGEGLKNLRQLLFKNHHEVRTERWQGTKDPPVFLEIIHADLMSPMHNDILELSDMLKATQPWADIHFDERTSGIPYNPPPSHVMWLKDTDRYLTKEEAFSHSYPERMWAPKMDGLRFETGNLGDGVALLQKEPTTRQCYIPMWFPEDIIAANLGERVPCSFGWHFYLHDGLLHCSYHMRSCDVVRHLHNDLYFANRLTLWMIEKSGIKAEPGSLHFSSTSLHCFRTDKPLLKILIK